MQITSAHKYKNLLTNIVNESVKRCTRPVSIFLSKAEKTPPLCLTTPPDHPPWPPPTSNICSNSHPLTFDSDRLLCNLLLSVTGFEAEQAGSQPASKMQSGTRGWKKNGNDADAVLIVAIQSEWTLRHRRRRKPGNKSAKLFWGSRFENKGFRGRTWWGREEV